LVVGGKVGNPAADVSMSGTGGAASYKVRGGVFRSGAKKGRGTSGGSMPVWKRSQRRPENTPSLERGRGEREEGRGLCSVEEEKATLVRLPKHSKRRRCVGQRVARGV